MCVSTCALIAHGSAGALTECLASYAHIAIFNIDFASLLITSSLLLIEQHELTTLKAHAYVIFSCTPMTPLFRLNIACKNVYNSLPRAYLASAENKARKGISFICLSVLKEPIERSPIGKGADTF